MYLRVSCVCVNIRVCVYMPILFSCAHSTGQKTESTATDPSRWSSSPPTWRRTSSAEYFGSTMQHGYSDTGGSCFKWKIISLGEKAKHTFIFAALLPIFLGNFCDWFVFPVVITTANLFCDCTHHPLICRPVHSSCAESFCSLTMPLH